MKTTIRHLTLLVVFLSFILPTNAQSDTEFWFAAPDLQQLHGDRPIYLRIATASQTATVTISIPANPAFTPIKVSNIPANSSTSIDLTPYISSIENVVQNTPQKKGLLISSTARITCFYEIANGNNGDMFALKGSNGLGTKFTLPFQNTLLNSTDGYYYTTDFIIVATENNTNVRIESTCDLLGQSNRIVDITLQKGETFVCSIKGTSTGETIPQKPDGTIVTSTKPIAITVKDDSVKYSSLESGYDTAGDQLIPDRMAGNQFIVIKSYFKISNVSSPDFFYIFATEAGTDVFVNGILKATLANPGDSYVGSLTTESSYISTSLPAQIFQISGFGAELGGAVIPAIKCTGSQEVNIPFGDVKLNFYANIIAPAAIINDFTLNGVIVNAAQFKPVTGTPNANEWYYARISVPSSLAGTNQSVIIKNSKGKFHLGVIQGDNLTTRFGYFSDFSTNTITFANKDNPTIPLNNIETVCYQGNFQIDASIPDAKTYTWTGPNGFNSTDPFIQFSNFNTPNIGVYNLQVETQGCGIANQSIELKMDKPIADFTFTTSGCEGDRIQFSSASTAVRWVWDFNNGATLDTQFPFTTKQSFPNAGDYNITLKVYSALGCPSDEVVKTLSLSSIPQALYTASPITCIDKEVLFKDASAPLAVGTITAWQWDLDNGTGPIFYNNGNDQTVTYTTWGKKNVRLVIKSNTGCESSGFALPNLIIHPNPVPNFTLPEVCLDDANALFTNTTSSPDGNTTFTYNWNFNAGSPAISPGPTVLPPDITVTNPSVKYNQAGIYKISLEVTGQGCVATETKTFTVNGANPTPQFTIDNSTSLCSNLPITITNNSTVGIGDITKLEIYWDAADPNSKIVDENPTPDKKYYYQYPNFQSPASVTKTIKLVAYSGNATTCISSKNNDVILQAAPLVNFNLIPGICIESAPRQIIEATTTTPLAGSFTYAGSGVSPSGLFNPSIPGAGTYTISATFTTDKGCFYKALQNITVWPRPIANFTYSPVTCEKTPVQFQSNSTAVVGNLTNWKWNFGDGTSIQNLNNENPFSYTFSAANTYTVGLTVTTQNGCTSLPKEQIITFHPLPQPAFDLPNVCLPVGQAIFTNQSQLNEPSGLPLTYLWDYGDPLNTSTTQGINGLHYYKQTGPYPVTLTATSQFGCKESITQQLTTLFAQPKAAFKSLDSACLGTSISFIDETNSNGSTIDSWHWNLGDGTSKSQPDPIYTYSDKGVYPVSFYIITKEGCHSDTVTKKIPIYAYPEVDAGADLYAFEEGSTLLPAKALGNAVLFQWTPPDFLSKEDVLNPLIVNPLNDITYTLKVTGRGACAKTDQIKVTVLRKPVVSNTFTPNGDGYNEKWIIKNIENYPTNTVEVYNTQGQLIYKTYNYSNSNGWDGKTNGKPVPIGTYYYVINPRLGRKMITGYVTILR